MRYLIIALLIIGIMFPKEVYAFRYKGMEIILRGSVDNRYDDNITFAPTNEKADFYTTPSLGLEAKYEDKRVFFDIYGDLSQDIYYTHSQYDHMTENVNLNLEYQPTKCDTVTLRNTFIHDYEPRSFEMAFGRLYGRYSYYWNSLDINLKHEITRQLSIALRYSNYSTIYSEPSLVNSDLNSFGTQAQYIVSSASVIFASYDYSLRAFSDGGSPSFHTFSGGFRQYVTKKLYVEAYGGGQVVNSTAEGGGEAKPYYSATLFGELDANTTASISYLNETSIMSYSKDAFSKWQVSADVFRKITQRLWLTGAAFYGNGEYQNTDLTNSYSGARAGLIYDVGKGIEASVMYTYANNNSNFDFNDYTKNVIRIGITARY